MKTFEYVRNGHNIVVEAYQFRESEEGHTCVFPRWFMEALAGGRIEKNIHTQSWHLDRKRVINDGEWLVWTAEIGIFEFPFTDSEFHDAFTKVSEQRGHC